MKKIKFTDVSLSDILKHAEKYYESLVNEKNKARERRRVLQGNNTATKKGIKKIKPKNKTITKRA